MKINFFYFAFNNNFETFILEKKILPLAGKCETCQKIKATKWYNLTIGFALCIVKCFIHPLNVLY